MSGGSDMSENIDMKEHLRNLMDALVDLSPSRSMVSQFILMLPKDLRVIEHSYPEITSFREARDLLTQLGIEFGDSVTRKKDSFAE